MYRKNMLSGIVIGDPTGRKRSLICGIILVFVLHKKRRPQVVRPDNAYEKQRRIIHTCLMFITIICLLLIPLDIRVPSGQKEIKKHIPHIQLIVDVSLSMAADDVQPSRFAVAKKLIQDLVSDTTNVSLSLIAFSGIPLVEIPFTTDVGAFLAHVNHMELADFPPTVDFLGTAMGDALLLALDNLASTNNEGGHIILITDGDSSVGLDPLEVVAAAETAGVIISPFALGNEEYVLGLDKQGRDVVAYIDIPTLQTIAQRTGGIFHHVLPGDTQGSSMHDMLTMMKESAMVRVHETFFSINTILLPFLLLLILLQFIRKIIIFMRLHSYIQRR